MEIKFRAWDTKEQKMYYDSFLIYANGKFAWRNSPEEENENHILMQYTGLKDKNGVEIYEGDIIECADWVEDAHAYNTWIRVVTWCSTNGMWIGIDGEVNKILGNIHENPELME